MFSFSNWETDFTSLYLQHGLLHYTWIKLSKEDKNYLRLMDNPKYVLDNLKKNLIKDMSGFSFENWLMWR